MSNSDGKISAPISQSDIKVVLGISTNSLAAACQSANINEKAACKPSYIQSYEPLTTEQRKESNYSTYIETFSNPVLLARAVVSGEAWRYGKPQAPYYRRLDFNGYNHNVGNWVTIAPQTDSVAADRNLAIDIDGNGDATASDIQALLSLLELGYLAQYSPTELNFGFLLRSSEFTETTFACYYMPLTGTLTIRDIVDNGKLTIPANTFTSEGTWHIIPVFTTAAYEQGARVYITADDASVATWLPIPYSNISSVVVSDTSTDYPVDRYIDIQLSSASASISDRGVVTLSDVDVVISNTDTTTSYRVVISSATISSGVIAGAFELEGGAANVAANSTTITSIQSSQVQFEVADPSLENIAIELEYYTDNYSSQRRTKYIYIELV